MITIAKHNPPRSLQNYRAQPGAVYDGPNFTPVKAEIRDTLVAEQHGLCAYCMRRIHATDRDMKVEHWQCQDHYPERQLDYSNLLGACKGHEGEAPNSQTCDTCKGNATLKFNPADPSHDVSAKITYRSSDGGIESPDEEFSLQIGKEGSSCHKADGTILNLNHPLLKENRKKVLIGLSKILGASPGTRTESEIKDLIRKQIEKSIWPEYVGVTLYWLSRSLRKVQ